MPFFSFLLFCFASILFFLFFYTFPIKEKNSQNRKKGTEIENLLTSYIDKGQSIVVGDGCRTVTTQNKRNPQPNALRRRLPDPPVFLLQSPETPTPSNDRSLPKPVNSLSLFLFFSPFSPSDFGPMTEGTARQGKYGGMKKPS